MKFPKFKDLLFVVIQLILFIIYLIPVSILKVSINHLIKDIGCYVALFGITVITLAILQLNRNLTPFPSPKEDGTLIQTGLYKFVRHPIYSGIILCTIGFGTSQESIWKIGIGVSLWILFFFKSKYEEKMLSIHFNDYDLYVNKTNRFFPFW